MGWDKNHFLLGLLKLSCLSLRRSLSEIHEVLPVIAEKNSHKIVATDFVEFSKVIQEAKTKMVNPSCLWLILLIIRLQNESKSILVGNALRYSYFQAKLHVFII